MQKLTSLRVQQGVMASCSVRLRAFWGVGSCFFLVNTSCERYMRCTESILVGRQHMVEVEGGEFQCVPGRSA